MDGTTVGLTPLPYQYSGRHISYWKLLVSVVDRLAPGVTGKIQVGAEPGDSAQVIVPACAVPLAGGTAPNAPDVEVTEPVEAALLQAVRPMAAATAHTVRIVIRRVIRSPSVVNECAQQPPGHGVWPGCGAGVSILNSHIKSDARIITNCHRCTRRTQIGTARPRGADDRAHLDTDARRDQAGRPDLAPGGRGGGAGPGDS